MPGPLSPLGALARRHTPQASGPAGTALLWLRSTDLSLANGDPVASWPDQSGNSNHATAVSSARPTYLTSQINGLPAVSFDGSANIMSLAADIVAGGAFTLYAVGHWPGASSAWDPLAGTVQGYEGVYIIAGTVYSVDDGIGVQSAAFSGSARDLIARWSRPSLAAAVTATATGFSATSLSAANTAATTLNRVGARPGVDFGAGTFAELLFYGRALSGPEQTATESYLTARYGLALP